MGNYGPRCDGLDVEMFRSFTQRCLASRPLTCWLLEDSLLVAMASREVRVHSLENLGR